jgi:hypothetical protein
MKKNLIPLLHFYYIYSNNNQKSSWLTKKMKNKNKIIKKQEKGEAFQLERSCYKKKKK